MASSSESYSNFKSRITRHEDDADEVNQHTFGYNGSYLSVDSAVNATTTQYKGISASVIDQAIRSHGIVNRHSADWYNKFSRFGIIDPFNTNTTTKEYIFITKPDLHLYSPSESTSSVLVPNTELTDRSPFFVDALNRYEDVGRQLQYSLSGSSECPFIPILTNSIASAVDQPSISASTFDSPSNVYGVNITYRGSSFASDYNFDFNMDFKDTKYLEVYMFFKMYDMYERMKWLGYVSPTSSLYTYRRILHDQMAIYKFIVGDDGCTILYWSRMIGCYPTTVPRDVFGDLAAGEINLSTSWTGQFVRDMDPAILTDFNRVTYNSRQGKSVVPLFDSSTMMTNAVWPSSVGVTEVEDDTMKFKKRYYLRWFD